MCPNCRNHPGAPAGWRVKRRRTCSTARRARRAQGAPSRHARRRPGPSAPAAGRREVTEDAEGTFMALGLPCTAVDKPDNTH